MTMLDIYLELERIAGRKLDKSELPDILQTLADRKNEKKEPNR
ncbi:MAG: hypothetical protein AB9835_12220 [Eubacteriales bacterium]